MDQHQQSPSTGESTKDQHKQEPARSDLPERPDVSRPSPEPPPQHGGKGPKSGGTGPKQ